MYRASHLQSMKALPYYMAYGSKARLLSDQVCVRFDNSPENIKLMYRQWHWTVKKLKKTRKQLIAELNDRATARHTTTEDNYTELNLRPGDRVLRCFEGRPSKLHPKWDGPFIIRDAYPSNMFSPMTSNGHILKTKVNGSRIKCFNGSTDDFYYTSRKLHRNNEVRKKLNESLNRR